MTTTPIKFIPLRDRVLVREDKDKETISAGGIIVPATAKKGKTISRGEVLAVGDEVKDLKVGDSVIFEPHGSGWDVEIDGQAVTVFKEKEILGVEA